MGAIIVPMARWPYSFALDDLDIQGCIFEPSSMDEPMLNAGNRVPGVYVLHRPSGQSAITTTLASREANLRVAMFRLNRLLLRRAADAAR
jgi:hypothetical protein